MAIGDNFDTTTPGMINRTTGRRSGHGRMSRGTEWDDLRNEYKTGRYLSDDNMGHPCNAGCGCKSFCGGYSGPQGCFLPPELTITVAKAGSRGEARAKIGASSSYGGGDIWHLVWSNGAYRGRKCCSGDDCNPCEVTTLSDGTKSTCSYVGVEGTTRHFVGNTSRLDPRLPGGENHNPCLEDGDRPPANYKCLTNVGFDKSTASTTGKQVYKCSYSQCTRNGGRIHVIPAHCNYASYDNEKDCLGDYVCELSGSDGEYVDSSIEDEASCLFSLGNWVKIGERADAIWTPAKPPTEGTCVDNAHGSWETKIDNTVSEQGECTREIVDEKGEIKTEVGVWRL